MNRTVNARILNLSSLQDSFDSWVVIKNAQHPVSTRFIAMSRNKLLVFVADFTVAYAVKGEISARSRPFGPQFGLKIGGGGAVPPGPSPGNTLLSILDKAESKKFKITTYPMECQ